MITHPNAHEYQTKAAEFGLSTKTCYWMIDMGLGKTLITLIASANIKEPMLVVAPLRPLYSTWPAEIEKWFPELSVSILHGPHKDYNFTRPADIYLINPEGFKWLENKLQKFKAPFKHLVIDEGSMWKSHSTARFKTLKRIRPVFKYKFILSGTPCPQSLMDLWSQYYILDSGERLGKTITNYRDQFFNVQLINNQFPQYSPKVGAFEAIMARVNDVTFRLSTDDYLQMPELTNNIIELELTPELRKQYKSLEKDFILQCGETEVEAFNAATLSSKLRQFIQGGLYTDPVTRTYERLHSLRLIALENLIEEAGQPILCAIQFKFELEMIRDRFKIKLGHIPYIGGGVSAQEGQRIIDKWNNGDLPLLVCHPKALSHGANLQTGGHIILWYGLTWSLEQYMQLIKRLHRQGQTKGVIVHHFVMRGTIDDRASKALIAKENVQQAVLDYFRRPNDKG